MDSSTDGPPDIIVGPCDDPTNSSGSDGPHPETSLDDNLPPNGPLEGPVALPVAAEIRVMIYKCFLSNPFKFDMFHLSYPYKSSPTNGLIVFEALNIDMSARALSKVECSEFEDEMCKALGNKPLMFHFDVEEDRLSVPFIQRRSHHDAKVCVPARTNGQESALFYQSSTSLGFLIGIAVTTKYFKTWSKHSKFHVGSLHASLYDEATNFYGGNIRFSDGIGLLWENESTLRRFIRDAHIRLASPRGTDMICVYVTVPLRTSKGFMLAIIRDLRYFTDNGLIRIKLHIKVEDHGYSNYDADGFLETYALVLKELMGTVEWVLLDKNQRFDFEGEVDDAIDEAGFGCDNDHYWEDDI